MAIEVILIKAYISHGGPGYVHKDCGLQIGIFLGTSYKENQGTTITNIGMVPILLIRSDR